MDYLAYTLIMVGIYLILSSSLNLVAGYAGILSLAHAAFFGAGAYTVALMALRLHSPAWLCLTSAVVVSALVGAVIGTPSLRVRSDYFVIATFAFQVISFSVLNNLMAVTNGPMGLPGIPKPAVLGWRISSNGAFLLIIATLCMATMLVSYRIGSSPFGRVLRAIREDEPFAASLGKNVAAFKVSIFVVAASIASVAGAIYAYYVSFIDPTSFTVMESIFILSIVIIGGAGSLWGPVLGSLALVGLPEILRFVGVPGPIVGNIRQIVYGLMLVAFMLWRPQGLVGERALEGPESVR